MRDSPSYQELRIDLGRESQEDLKSLFVRYLEFQFRWQVLKFRFFKSEYGLSVVALEGIFELKSVSRKISELVSSGGTRTRMRLPNITWLFKRVLSTAACFAAWQRKAVSRFRELEAQRFRHTRRM
jgi:hypothetical protein